jgi:hypothetical protein
MNELASSSQTPEQLPELYVDHINALYPYHVWFSGERVVLRQGQDYTCPTPNLRRHLYLAAGERGHRIRTRRLPNGTGLIIQAVDVRGLPLPPITPSAGTPAP